jgi:tetratricopeptide (TPR) repeat protein
VPFGLAGLLGGIYMVIGQIEKALEWEEAYLDARSDPLAISRSNWVLQLVMAGRSNDAMAAAPEVLAAAEATGNPYALSAALLGYGFAFRDAEPEKALDAMRRGLVIAETEPGADQRAYLALNIGRLEARRGDWAAALDHLTVALRINRDSGSTVAIRSPLAILAGLLDGLGCYEPAATIAGFAVSPLTTAAFPELTTMAARLRHILGDQTYESLARNGEAMTTAAMVTFAYDQIDQARTAIEQRR